MIQTKCKTGRENSENAGNVFVAEYRENMYDRRESVNFCAKSLDDQLNLNNKELICK